MTTSLDAAMRRLEGALGLLEAAVTRRLEAERRRGDLETELQIMQDDRARLAVDLDGAMARLRRVEAATKDVSGRVDRAVGAIRDVLERSGGGNGTD
jgi:predicted  nucleic acid-binding Zn-ribbon protein